MSKPAKLLAVLDIETAPFNGDGTRPVPFAWGLLYEVAPEKGARGAARVTTPVYKSGWHANAFECRKGLGEALKEIRDTHVAYAHNLAFDQPLMAERTGGALILRDGGALECRINGCVVRDSMAILPASLARLDVGKRSIDIAKLAPRVRDRHRPEIEAYLEADVRGLYAAVTRGRAILGGRHLTVAAAAKADFKRGAVEVEPLSHGLDALLRQFYHGGRVEAVERGEHVGDLVALDVNSAYPDAMRNVRHPVGGDHTWTQGDRVTDATAFVHLRCTATGAFPHVVRGPDGVDRVGWPRPGQWAGDREPWYEHRVTVHEWRAAVETGALGAVEVLGTWDCSEWSTFAEYVDRWWARRAQAQADGDALANVVSKAMLNSLYGKFGTNPDNWKDWFMSSPVRGFPDAAEGWAPAFEWASNILWSKPAASPPAPWNVGTAASITGAVRAKLWRAMCAADGVLYVDTDSILARGAGDLTVGAGLGEWKVEARPSVAAVFGVKTYALGEADAAGDFTARDGSRHRWAKAVAPGVRWPVGEVTAAIRRGEYTYRQDAPDLRPTGAAGVYEQTVRTRL